MPADALSDLLRTVRLTGATFFDVVAKAPWVAEQPGPEIVLPKILPGAEHLIAYHLVIEGQCFAYLIGGEPIAVNAGEVIVFTRGDPHVMASGPGMRGDPFNPGVIDSAATNQLPLLINYGGIGPTTKVVCGFLACDAQLFNPLLENLPAVIKVGDPKISDKGWFGQFIHFVMMESAEKRVGGESVLARLSELMFIEVVRRHLEALPPEQVGWLAGLRDPFVGKTLSLMHGDPARNWTLEKLAKDVGLSRSVLAERFAHLVCMPPMQYLAKWRMQIASGLLSGGSVNVATVAAEIGYSSEAAFSRAFKKRVGVSPSDWRRRFTHDCSHPTLRRVRSPLADPGRFQAGTMNHSSGQTSHRRSA
jgi:AraC-like DNA-binding protein